MEGSLLPLSAITAKLLNETSEMITEADGRDYPNPPSWWRQVGEQAIEAARTGSMGETLIPSTAKAIEEMMSRGSPEPMIALSISLKLIVLGWMMAEKYLEQQIEKSATQ